MTIATNTIRGPYEVIEGCQEAVEVELEVFPLFANESQEPNYIIIGIAIVHDFQNL